MNRIIYVDYVIITQKLFKQNTIFTSMLKKRICKRCERKISEKYEFCPYCGNLLNENSKQEDWGILGQNDFMSSAGETRFPKGLNIILNSLMKNLDKQFKNLDREISGVKTDNKNPWTKIKKGGISISISTSGDSPPKIKIRSFGNDPKFKQEEQQIKEKTKKIPSNLSPGNLKKLSDLPKEEPSTNIRRLSNKVIYEIDMPNVKSIKDVSIIRLENSIEIKALAKNKVYFKLIPINLPIMNYNLSKGKLVLELGVKE